MTVAETRSRLSVAAPAEAAAGAAQAAAAEVTRAPEARRERSAPIVEEAGAGAEAAPGPDHRGQEAESPGRGLDQDPGRDPGQVHAPGAAARHAASQAAGAGAGAGSRGAEVDQEARAYPDQDPGLQQNPNPDPRHQPGLIDVAVQET